MAMFSIFCIFVSTLLLTLDTLPLDCPHVSLSWSLGPGHEHGNPGVYMNGPRSILHLRGTAKEHFSATLLNCMQYVNVI